MKFLEAKVVTLGQWGVGKTAVTQRYVNKTFESGYRSTIGACFLCCKLNIEDINLTLQIWDTAGEEKYKTILPTYCRAGNVILLIFHLTSYESITKIKTIISELQKHCEKHVVVILIGNKLDLIETREVSEKEAKEFASSIDVSYYEVSALTDYGIDDVFQKVASELVNLIKQGNTNSLENQDIFINSVLENKTKKESVPEEQNIMQSLITSSLITRYFSRSFHRKSLTFKWMVPGKSGYPARRNLTPENTLKKKHLEVVGKHKRNKFPKSFDDLNNDGKPLDTGHHFILGKLIEHNNYRNKRKGGLNSALQSPLKQQLAFVPQVINKANEKLGLNGTTLKSEEDGTQIFDDDDLMYYVEKDKPILVMQESQLWANRSMTNLLLDLPVISHTENQTLQPSETGLTQNVESQLELSDVPNSLDVPEAQEGGEEVAQIPLDENNEVNEFLVQERTIFTTWEDYQVDWTKISSDALELCNRGTKDNDVINRVIRQVIGSMLFHNVPIKKKHLELIAKQFRDKFPKSFDDRTNDGKRLDTGYHFILKKLLEHNNYRKKRKGGLSTALQIPLKQQRALEIRKSGTINWQPDEHPEGKTEESLKLKQDFLKNINTDATFDMTTGDIADALQATYSSQRFFINQFPGETPLLQILQDWPIFLSKTCLLWHFSKLTGCSLDIPLESFQQKVKTILIFGYEKMHLPYEHLSESKRLQHMWTVIQKRFNENDVNLLQTCSFSVNERDVQINLAYPCIIRRSLQGCRIASSNTENQEVKNDLPVIPQDELKCRYFVCYEKRVFMRCESLLESLQMMIFLFFVFNGKYPSTLASTLVFIEMYILNIYDKNSINNPCRAGNRKAKDKVLTLYNLLKKKKQCGSRSLKCNKRQCSLRERALNNNLCLS
ncbi:uncharacterized protein LOC127284729 [Leptopilina boulardi]|uniref:uncharacterized protein LOC127284729 n=1 Tax=Leptopilina boulardi TaxID=63433 RepID=UPI0021F68C33|nr:uncharacterized protein LOC127284729 [Leptopilina boulardi]